MNDDDVDAILTELKFDGIASHSNGFTYVDRDYRLVFLHEDPTRKENQLVLAHEEGHICCGHFSHAPIVGMSVEKEYEANEFAHYLLHPSLWLRTRRFVTAHKWLSAAAVLAFVLCMAGCVELGHVERKNSYYGNYCVTASGSKYHEAGCISIKNKTNTHRMPLEEYENGRYGPCGMCLPAETE